MGGFFGSPASGQRRGELKLEIRDRHLPLSREGKLAAKLRDFLLFVLQPRQLLAELGNLRSRCRRCSSSR